MAINGSRPSPDPEPDAVDVDGHPAAGSASRPAAVWCVAAALAAQGLLLVWFTVIGLVDLLPGHDRVLSVSLALTVAAAGGAWLLLAGALGVLRGHAWVRGPITTVQVLGVLVGASFVQGGSAPLGWGVLAVALLTLVGLHSGPVAAHTGRRTYAGLDQD